jgi:restriction system protein
MIPDYQTLMLPLLQLLADGQAHSKTELVNILGKHFNLSENELNEFLPNSKKGRKKFNNRIHWAQAHLKMAGLIEYTGKELVKITERGKQLLSEEPAILNILYLRNKFHDYDEKLKSSYSKKKNDLPIGNDSDSTTETPEEQINTEYQKIKIALEVELLSKLKTVHPSDFEKIVVELLVKMGYGGSIEEAGKTTQYTNDEGIDGIIKEDKLGLDVIYVQAKRWEGIVSRPEIQKFVGALAGKGAKKGVFITTSDFSKDAISYASKMNTKIVLIDGETLAQYMIDYNLGVSIKDTYEIKKINSNYFEEE